MDDDKQPSIDSQPKAQKEANDEGTRQPSIDPQPKAQNEPNDDGGRQPSTASKPDVLEEPDDPGEGQQPTEPAPKNRDEPSFQALPASPPSACDGFELRLILDSRTKNGEILVDGEPAFVASRGLLTTICIPAAGNYTITARGTERSCEARVSVPLNDNLINLCS
ncbi:MAG: hypothetical protein AAGD01_18005 [Acidobacteriota bacterium]